MASIFIELKAEFIQAARKAFVPDAKESDFSAPELAELKALVERHQGGIAPVFKQDSIFCQKRPSRLGDYVFNVVGEPTDQLVKELQACKAVEKAYIPAPRGLL